MIAFLLAHSAALAAGFGGLRVDFAAELDPDGAEPLLVLSARPLVTETGGGTLVWAPLSLRYAFLGQSFLGQSEKLDRGEMALLRGERRLEQGSVGATFELAGAAWDHDQGLLDVLFGGGGLAVDLAGEDLRLLVGADLRWRTIFPEAGSEYSVLLGLPVGIRARTPSAWRPYAAGVLELRPSVSLAGIGPVAIDGHGSGEVGWSIVQGEDLDLRASLRYDLAIDTLTASGFFAAHTFLAGVGARFR